MCDYASFMGKRRDTDQEVKSASATNDYNCPESTESNVDVSMI